MGQQSSQPQEFYSEAEKQQFLREHPWLAGLASLWVVKRGVEHQYPETRPIFQTVEDIGSATAETVTGTAKAVGGTLSIGKDLASAIGWLGENRYILYIAGGLILFKMIK